MPIFGITIADNLGIDRFLLKKQLDSWDVPSSGQNYLIFDQKQIERALS